jgi:hypothetical protein
MLSDRAKGRALLELAVQWRELAVQIERLQRQSAPAFALPGGRPTLH